jgi:hypothetical protein
MKKFNLLLEYVYEKKANFNWRWEIFIRRAGQIVELVHLLAQLIEWLGEKMEYVTLNQSINRRWIWWRGGGEEVSGKVRKKQRLAENELKINKNQDHETFYQRLAYMLIFEKVLNCDSFRKTEVIQSAMTSELKSLYEYQRGVTFYFRQIFAQSYDAYE